jgi:hypothetical protein
VPPVSVETRQTLEVLLALLPWVAFLVAVVASLTVDLRDELRTSRAARRRAQHRDRAH